jgi:hypothetical protein
MRLPQRIRIVAPGSALVFVTGVAAAGIGLPIIFTNPPGFEPFVAGLGLFILAPVFVALAGIASWVAGGSSSAPAYVVVLGLVAIGASPLHALVKSRWATSASIIGFVAWVLCQAFMALAARSI